MEKKMTDHLENLIIRYPELQCAVKDIEKAFYILSSTFRKNRFLFICGNGGSASDSEHIVGELMKSFILKRRISYELERAIDEKLKDNGKLFVNYLQRGLKAVSLNGHPALSSAYSNDVESSMVYAQQLSVLAEKGDSLLAISTSGDSENVYRCIQIASVMNVNTVLLTGEKGGRCSEIADCSIKVPENETFKVQELHLPVYHALCMMLEEEFYG
jgi:D-sedoheptulose 7-phosphate isomerase